MRKILLFLLIVGFAFTSCGEYQKLLKSTDKELKYDKAVEYFNAKKYMKSIYLFEDISTLFRGEERSELILNYLGNAYIGQKDYYTASEYFKTYIKSYPRGRFIQEVRYMVAFCNYKDSPEPKLDQEATYKAIDAFQNYLDLYPNSDRAADAVKLMDELNNKLAKKYYMNAKLYYNLGTYMGNNYGSAVITAENGLKKYPANLYREEFMFLILQAKYQEAINSMEQKREERFQNVIDEYYNYINEYPKGKYVKDAEKIFNDAKKNVKQ